jgi:eukaryotic-like serine/threonine-protein kinase
MTEGATETFGRYRLMEQIGRGGMAEVFKAKSFGVEGFEKVLVIKRIVPELAVHEQFVDMFVREAKLAVLLSHANIVQVFDLGRIDADDSAQPSYFIAMEYVPGLDLASLLNRHKKIGQLPVGAAIFVTLEVAKALDHAHRRTGEDGKALGLVHRDISPHNILLSWEGDVKVTDFGIAKAADTIAVEEKTSENLEAARATGKVPFMSPEQSRSEATDARSDLFSLGTVLYQMLAGANPFSAPTISETIRRIGVSEYPPLALVRPDIPSELSAIVDKLLALSPSERYSSAADVVEAVIAYRYTAEERFGASELATLLSSLREGGNDTPDIEPTSVLDEPSTAADRTPVEVPSISSEPPTAGRPAQPSGRERREVTLLLLAFDAQRGDVAPEAQLRRVREVLDRHGAWIEQVSGRQVVAIFGLGDTDGRDAEAAVRAALVLVRERRHGVIPSAGIHSGPLSVDDGGLPVNDERLHGLLATSQSLARATEGQVALSNVASRLVRRSFVTEPLETSRRAVVGGGRLVRRALAVDSARARFVGRIPELKRLGSILASATRKGVQIVVVRGETGLGKSRLLTEAKRRLARGNHNVAFYAAACPLNGASIPFSGLRAMLHVLCGTQEDDDPDRIVEVRPRLRALGLSNDQAAAVLNLLGARVRRRSGSGQRAIVRGAFERMVQSLCRDRLHCFAWDDGQAIDRETLEALIRVLKRHQSTVHVDPVTGKNIKRRGLPAVFILGQRGEIPPALAKRSDLHVIDLDELNEEETGKHVESLLGARSIPKELLEYVRAAAGGHPLFVDELLRELGDGGVVQVLNGTVTIKTDTQASAPRTLRTLIADRVSRLQMRERSVLQGLAVLGEPAFTQMLSGVVEQTLPVLDRNLSTLENKGLVRRTGPTQVRFASPLYQEIVLDAMPPTAQRDKHALAAAAYEGAQLTGPGEAAERIAEHLLGAGDREGAVDAFWLSADDKLAADQLENALRSMMRGLDVADPAQREIEQLIGWVGQIADAVTRVRKATGLREALAAVVRQIDARGDNAQRASAHIHSARALGSINLFDEAYLELEAAAASPIEDPALLRASLNAEAQLAMRQGLFKRTIAAGERLAELGETEDSETLLTLALARAMAGDVEGADASMAKVEARGEPRDAIEAVTRQKHRMLMLMAKHDYTTAAVVATELAALARAAGLRFDTAAALHNLGDIHDRLGDHPRAYAAFVESLELTRQLDQDRLSNLNRMHLCLLDGLRSPEGAQDRLKGLIRYADGHGYLWDVLEGRFLLSRLVAAHGDHDRARSLLQEVIEMARDYGHRLIEQDATKMANQLSADGEP